MLKLIQKQLFTKEEYFSQKKNIKIALIYQLFEKGKIRKNNIELFSDFFELLKDIKKDIKDCINRKNLERFLKNDESIIIQRLSLIQLVTTKEKFNPNYELELLKKKEAEINETLNKLIDIKDNLSIYHKKTYEQIIKRILSAIKNSSELDIIKSIQINKKIINECSSYQNLITKIKKVHNFLLFNEIYEISSKENEDIRFKNAYNEIEEIYKLLNDEKNLTKFFEKYKEVINKILKKSKYKIKNIRKFIDDIIKYYNLTDKNIIVNLTTFFQNKKYVLDKEMMDYFLKFFENIKNSYLCNAENTQSGKIIKDNKNIGSIKRLSDLKNFDYIDIELRPSNTFDYGYK